MFIPTRAVLKRVLTLSVAGTRGGIVRLQILLALEKRPLNINEMSKMFSLDYKSIQHHTRVLERSGLIAPSGRKYANSYSLSSLLKVHKSVLIEIKRELGKSRYSESNK